MIADDEFEALRPRYLSRDIRLYSLRRPPGRETASIYSTRSDGADTFQELIENDAIYDACARYLEGQGVPVFMDAPSHNRFLDLLEAELQAGRPIDAARARAIEQSGISDGPSKV